MSRKIGDYMFKYLWWVNNKYIMIYIGRMVCIPQGKTIQHALRISVKGNITPFHMLPNAFRDNIPRNNERMPCPYGQLDEIAIENKCVFPLQALSGMNEE